MNTTNKGHFKKLTWQQVRNDVANVNPKLAKIIDEIAPDDKYWVVKATYPYGALVMKRSLFMLPNKNGEIVPINDPSLSSTIRDGLSYNLQSNPVSLVLKNSFEIFLPLEDRTIPLSGIIKPGTAFGAWRILSQGKAEQPAFIWDMTSGARSVFMLPKITEVKKHMKLKKAYNLNLEIPNSLMKHWEIFCELANNAQTNTPWNAEIIYFSKPWFKHLDDPTWKSFYNYFYDAAWGGSEFWRNQPIWNLIFSLILKEYEAKPNAYIMDTVKYLLYMGVGALPGLAPVRDTLAGPFDLIQEIYSQDYEIRNYPPIIIQPEFFDIDNSKAHPVYYSLQFPTALEFKPSSRMRTSIISDLHEIRSLLIRYEQQLLSGKFNIKETSLNRLFEIAEYNYFHNGVELHSGMRNSAEIAKEDDSFVTTLDGVKHEQFPDKSSFLKGCIRIMRK